MTERLRESLSALMDDEANELELERVLSQIGEDDELRSTWVRYNAARAAVTAQPVVNLNLDISRRVSAAIAAEAAAASSGTSAWQRLLRPVGSFAVAASVTATVVFGGQQLFQAGGGDPDFASPLPAAGVSPVGFVNSVGAMPVRASYGTQPIPQLQPAARTAYKELARQRMEQYMQEHAGQAALNSPQGLVPYARVPHIEE
ncbi:sigma-E factor negative regulatory protein [Kineobactrum sediminis]|nr:sigma-E factor negative regulatory protein [Kineobactrum sediminis]